MAEAVVIGNAGIDTTVYLYGADIDCSVEAHFSPNLDYVGHAGGYSAGGYAALGRSTALIGHVGDDMGGRLISETIARDGINRAAIWNEE
ncbi:MAG: hypothetical protein HC822_08555 [Oscillochloris sp.]|nr:hypothetical protein [Oscillochloris sp.]